VDHQSVIADGRTALQATLRFGARHLGPAKWEPGPGSEAAAELSNTETRLGGDLWGEDPPRTAYAAANLMMTGVLDDLASIHQMLGDQMPVIGPTVVARSAIEITSGAWWLMQPGIGVRRRVCRELALSLTSARRARQVAEEFQATGFQVGQEIADALQQEARILHRITDLGISPPASPGYSPAVENERAMSATATTAAMLMAVLPASVPGTSVYRTYSAVTHGEIYGLMNFMAPGVTSDGSTLLHWHLPPECWTARSSWRSPASASRTDASTRSWAGASSSATCGRSSYGRSTTGSSHRILREGIKAVPPVPDGWSGAEVERSQFGALAIAWDYSRWLGAIARAVPEGEVERRLAAANKSASEHAWSWEAQRSYVDGRVGIGTGVMGNMSPQDRAAAVHGGMTRGNSMSERAAEMNGQIATPPCRRPAS